LPRRSFALGAAANWLAFAAALAVSFALTPYLIGALGRPRYDVWCVVENVLAFLTLLDLGVAACLVRHVARHHVAADAAGLNRMASSCLAVFSAAGGAAFVVGGAVLATLAGRLEVQAGRPGDVLPFMLVMLANLAVSLPLGVFGSILDGLERYPEKSAVRVVALAARTAGIVVAVRAGGGLFALGAVVAAVSAAEQLLLAGLCFYHLPGLKLGPAHVDRPTLRLVRASSADALLAMLAGRITGQTGAILLGIFLPPGSATFFAVGARLVEHAKLLLRTVTATLTPGVSAMEARGDHAGIRRLFLGATRGVLYVVLPVNAGLWWFGRPFLERWVGSDYVAGSFPTVAILGVTLSIGVAQSVASRVLYGLGQLRLFARLTLAEAAVNVCLTLVLIGPYGVTGVAVGVAVPNVLLCVAVIAYTVRLLGVPARDYLAAWGRPVAAFVVPVAIWLTLGMPRAAWPDIAAAGAAGMLPYALVVAGLEVPAGRGTAVVARLRSRMRPRPGSVVLRG